MTATLSANSAIPPYRRKAMDIDPNIEPKGHAAGVVYVAPDGDILLLRRSSAEANFAGHWALPGGGVDEGETPEQGAARESREEMGVDADPAEFKLLDRTQTPTGKVFHTFAKPVSGKFTPKLNDEHTGFCWAPLDMLPGPIHPAVQATLKNRVGVAEDMAPEDWKGLRDGFVKWTGEEESEAEHAEDELCATDEALRLAMDRESTRTKSMDGHLHVNLTNISKATVNPYRGAEIPNAEALGLDPEKIYQLLRDPEELAKAAPTFNGKPLLHKHKPTKADDHPKDLTVGSTMNDAVFEDPYLKVSLSIWPQDDIDDIESELKNELSSGYRYVADMTPGNFRGMPFDGIMRSIVGNHVALVKDGRAGPDVIVGDSMENLLMKPTRLAALTLGLTAASLAPMLAMDAALPKDLFGSITTKNIVAKKAELLAGVRKAVDGKLRKGLALDASMSELGKVMDNVAGLFGEKEGADATATPEQEASMAAPIAAGPAASEYVNKDAEPLKAFLKEKGMGDEDIMKACDLIPKSMAGDEEDDEAKKKAKEEADKKAADAKAELEAKDAEMKDMVKKPAMDEAIRVAVKDARKTEQGIRAALAFVRPYVGELPETMAFDSADDVHRQAAKILEIEGAADIHASALPTLIKLKKPAGAYPVAGDPPLAMDAATVKDFSTRFPDAGRIHKA